MSYPDNSSLYSIFEGSLGDTVTIKTRSLGTANSYGEKIPTYSSGTTAYGRLKIVGANKLSKEFGYLQPGDAVALLKLEASIAVQDHVVFNSITYEVLGVVQKKTHLEVALKRVN